MSNVVLTLMQFALALMIGLCVTFWLRKVQYRLLCDLCETADRARFWEHVSSVLLTATPLILVLMFGPSDWYAIEPLQLFRSTVALSLLGVVTGVLVLAWQIARYLPAPGMAPRTAAATHAAPAVPARGAQA